MALLRSGKDPVIRNVGLGSNQDVAIIFNNMPRGISGDDKFDNVRSEILLYYNNETNHTVQEFRKTYFGKPWLVISVVTAFVLLVMTLLQTLYTIFSYEATKESTKPSSIPSKEAIRIEENINENANYSVNVVHSLLNLETQGYPTRG